MKVMFWLVVATIVVPVPLVAVGVWIGPSPILWAAWFLWDALAFGTAIVYEVVYRHR